MNIFLVFKMFEDWQEPTPIAAYKTVTRAHEECDKLNLQRSNSELESGMFYYVRNFGVPLHE